MTAIKNPIADLYDIPLRRLNGDATSLAEHRDKLILIVNVASKCGRTPQYAGLQRLYERFSPDGFTVLGFPCNQFNNEEPGSAAEIQEFCDVNYGVTFPLFEKIDVNGPRRHPLFARLCTVADDEGLAGEVAWNFEKFLIGRGGRTARRFRKTVEPSDRRIVDAIQDLL